ncbi:MAG: hypothetical protein F4Y12_11110 [Acidimicrobiaceae bacterium]|nr:hypothetical protein [Acidimicrobiaceae bacterium]MYH76573.1 hypothetical protein [Acidimicrobiaceae bacterium]MYK74580.1 hypothetical protein [Acidimicrobiaceae bacterium]
MHPIERLRYVARAGVVPVVPLVRESASALSSFADDPKGLLTSCRRLLDRRSDCAPLVWLAARMLTAMDPRSEARRVIGDLEDDATPHLLGQGMDALPAGSSVLAVGDLAAYAAALDDRPDLRWVEPDDLEAAGRADLVLMTSDCAGPSQALVVAETVSVAEMARGWGTPVWLIAGAGRILPERMWDLLSDRHRPDDPAMRGLAVLDLDRFVTRVVTPSGLRTPAEAARRSDCPIVPELFAR